MFAQGMAGMLRRMSDGAVNYSAAVNPTAAGALSSTLINANRSISIAAWCLGLVADTVHYQLPVQLEVWQKSDFG